MFIMQLLFKSQKSEPIHKSEVNQSETSVIPPKKRNPSRVRDHLANERTYLAWMRTAIALMGFGVVIARLRIFKPPMMPTPGNGWKLGLTFAVVGLMTVVLTTKHYFAVRHDIDEDTYEPGDRWVFLFSLAIILLGSGVIYYFFTVPLNPLSGLVFE